MRASGRDPLGRPLGWPSVFQLRSVVVLIGSKPGGGDLLVTHSASFPPGLKVVPGRSRMCKVLRGTIVAAVGMASLSCTAPPMQENGAAISFGIAGFDIGAILGSVLAPAEA